MLQKEERKMTNKGNRNRGKGFFQQQRPSFPFNIKQKFHYAVTLSVEHMFTHTTKNSMHTYRHTNVPPSRHDMSLTLCPLEIPGDVNPTPVSKPISKYTHRPARGEHMQTHRHSPLCHSLFLSLSLQLACSPTTDTPPFPSSQYHLFPVFLFPRFFSFLFFSLYFQLSKTSMDTYWNSFMCTLLS